MQRYTTKHFWRMKESEDGEFVRYEDVEYETKTNAQLFKIVWTDLINVKHEHRQAHALVEHLLSRVVVMFYIIMAMMGLAVGKLIEWSFGL
jgi:hypothetical protein